VLDPEAHLAEPVHFELLRSGRLDESRPLEAQFATLPTLLTPADLWQRAIVLGQACRQIGSTVLSLDLLVAAVALHHNALLVSFDTGFEAIAFRCFWRCLVAGRRGFFMTAHRLSDALTEVSARSFPRLFCQVLVLPAAVSRRTWLWLPRAPARASPPTSVGIGSSLTDGNRQQPLPPPRPAHAPARGPEPRAPGL